MFTGLVERMGEVSAIRDEPPGARLVIRSSETAAGVRVGASVAINGCCLTVVECDAAQMAFEAGPETLQRTNLGELKVGSNVNLETSLCVGDELGGHLVTGHVDGVGRLEKRVDEAEWSTFWFRMPGELSRQMASKGSVAVDGVSLTLVEVERERFSVALIPHTLRVTTLGALQVDGKVNLETDVLAKYVQRQLAWKAGS